MIGSSYLTRPLITVLFLGFASGLPLALTGATLGYWLADANIHKTDIAIFGTAATPYALKFLWAPLMDSLAVPGLTRILGGVAVGYSSLRSPSHALSC